MKSFEAHEFSCVCHEIPPIITPIFKSTPNVIKTFPLCQSCLLAFSKQCMPKFNKPTKAWQDGEGTLSWDANEAGDFVSTDQYVVNPWGRLVLGYSQKVSHSQLHVGTYCFMMLLQVLFEQKTKSLLELVSWWPRNTLNNGNGTWLLLKFTTCIVTMGFSMMNSLWRPARTTSRLCHFLELVLVIRIPLLSSRFKLSCECHRPLWFMFLCTGAKGADNLDFGVEGKGLKNLNWSLFIFLFASK